MDSVCDILAASAARQREQENAGAFSNALDEIKDDMKNIESDAKKIDCYAILDLIKDCIKCFIDSLKCCFKIKIS
jgi:hypothetical protein